MNFKNNELLNLLVGGDATAGQDQAERQNLCLEERVSAARQTNYESWVSGAKTWEEWRGHHERYVKDQVRRRYPLSAAFTPTEPSLRPGIEGNQYLLRLERIDRAMQQYAVDFGITLSVDEINRWIAVANAGPSAPAPKEAHSFADLGSLLAPRPSSMAPEAATLADFTDVFNLVRIDGRPGFVAFDAEFPRLLENGDWLPHICSRCGLAHFYCDEPVTLALMRYQVQEVLDVYMRSHKTSAVFAVPTVLDQLFHVVFFPAPSDASWGQAAALEPADDCSHLAAELIHARIDYLPEHWVEVGVLQGSPISDSEIQRLRTRHLDCLRRSSRLDYGINC